MKRFLMLLSFTFVAAAVLSACGQNLNCNPASYTNGILPQACYANGQANPNGGQNPFGQNPFGQNPFGQNPSRQNPFGQNPYLQNPHGMQPYWQGQQPFFGGQQGYQGQWGGSYVHVYGSNPYQYYGCRNPYCY